MKSTARTGKAINVANLELLLAYLIAMGAKYNPKNQTLTIAKVTLKLSLSKAKLQLVSDAFTIFNSARNLRRDEFKTLKKLCTRIINALIAAGASEAIIANAKTINRKIQGARAKAIVAVPPINPIVEIPVTEIEVTSENGVNKSTLDEIINISVSQQGFDSKEFYFSKLLTLLIAEPLYDPNETDLTTANLTLKQTAMQTTNSDVKTATPGYTNAITDCDAELYASKTGLVDYSKLIKAYCLSVLDSSNANYKKINHIHFKTA